MSEHPMYDTAVASLYETVLDPQHWQAAIADVSRYFAAPTATLFTFDFVASRASDVVAHGFDSAVARLYERYYCQLDPGRFAGAAASIGEWLSDEVLLDVRSPLAQEYVHDFAIPSGIGRVAGVKVAGDASHCVWLSLERPSGADPFGDEGKRRYLDLAPHFRRVTDMASRLKSLAMGDAIARACLDRLQAGLVVVDRSRRIHLVNAYGEALLGKRRALSMANRRLRCSTPSLDEHLGRLIVSACLPLASGGALRIAQAGSSGWLYLNVVPIPQRHDLASLLAEPLALVVITDPAAEVVPVDVYRALFGLTAAEAALLAGLVAGATVGGWARQRGISVATVRSQLRSLFDKTGADSQPRLMAMAKSLVPIH
jgi:DNA-binding CsgD family transcriptional regulator